MKKEIEMGVMLAVMLPGIIIGFIYVGGLFLIVPLAFQFIADMHAPLIITWIGYLALVATIILISATAFGLLVNVFSNNLSND